MWLKRSWFKWTSEKMVMLSSTEENFKANSWESLAVDRILLAGVEEYKDVGLLDFVRQCHINERNVFVYHLKPNIKLFLKRT